MAKRSGCVDLNETQVCSVERIQVCVRKNLFSSVHSLTRKIFSVMNFKGYFVYISVTFLC